MKNKGIKKLGFGFMRLPMKNNNEVDIETTKEMVDIFMSKGFSYFDTAYGYLGGQSERAIKKCLVDRYPRDKFLLATKLPAWLAKDEQEAKKMFKTSLERTGVKYFDYYLLHDMGQERSEYFDKYHIWDFLKEKKEKGEIKNLGFSIHAKADEVEEMLKNHLEVDFIQLQINYADWEDEHIQSRKCYEVARKYKKPIIIMEPVKGGSLSKLIPEAEKVFKDINKDASISSWAIRYAASLEGVFMVLSGMSTVSQVKDNTQFMENFKPLNNQELQGIKKVQKILEKIDRIKCTSCGYCMEGCPQHIQIYETFQSMNNYLVYDNLVNAKNHYKFVTRNGGKASNCIECGQCEKVCPQHIKIIDNLKRCVKVLEK